MCSPEEKKDEKKKVDNTEGWYRLIQKVDTYFKVIVITVPFVAGRLNAEEVPEVNPDEVAVVSAYCPGI